MPDPILRKYAFALLEKAVSHIATSNSGLTREYVEIPSLTPVRYRTVNEGLSIYDEFHEIASYVLNHEVFGKRYYEETVVRLVDDFVIEFLNKSPDRLDNETFEELYERFEKQLEEEYWAISSISPLYNVEFTEKNEIPISNGFSLVHDPLLSNAIDTAEDTPFFLFGTYKAAKKAVSVVDQLRQSIEPAVDGVE